MVNRGERTRIFELGLHSVRIVERQDGQCGAVVHRKVVRRLPSNTSSKPRVLPTVALVAWTRISERRSFFESPRIFYFATLLCDQLLRRTSKRRGAGGIS